MLNRLLRIVKSPMCTFQGFCAGRNCRTASTATSDYVSVRLEPEFDGSLVTVTLQKKPQNSLCSDHLRAITNTITKLEEDENVRAMIMKSAFPGLFCSGLDIMSMYNRTAKEIEKYWIDLQDMVFTSSTTNLITIAAMNGHCLAGGCAIPLSFDYRIIAENHVMGLHETTFGLVIPFFIENLVKNVIGQRQSERILQLGLLLTSQEALNIGFVDEVVPMDQVLTAAKKHAATWLKIPDSSRTEVKKSLRRAFIEDFESRRIAYPKYAASRLSGPQLQSYLKKSVEKLEAKKKL